MVIDKKTPTFVSKALFGDAKKGTPAWGGGCVDRVHAGVLGHFVGFSRVAFHAGSHDVGPRCASAFVAGDDVIEIELAFRQFMPAILTREMIAHEDVSSGESDFQAGEFVVDAQDEDPGNTKGNTHAMDQFILRSVVRLADP